MPAGGQGGTAQGHLLGLGLSQGSEVTPGKTTSTNPATTPRFCSAIKPVFSGLLPSSFIFFLKIFYFFVTYCTHSAPQSPGLWRVFPSGSLPCPRALLGIASAKAEPGQGLLLMPRFSHITKPILFFFNDFAEPIAQQGWRDPKAVKLLCHGSLGLQPASVVSNQHCWGRPWEDSSFK